MVGGAVKVDSALTDSAEDQASRWALGAPGLRRDSP